MSTKTINNIQYYTRVSYVGETWQEARERLKAKRRRKK